MNRLEATLRSLKDSGRPAGIVYLTSGYPDLEATIRIVPRLCEAGADAVELGLPFSDPVADGPVIQKASLLSLRHGYSLADHLAAVKEIRGRTEAPLVAMTYANLVFDGRGFDGFCRRAAAAGLDGLIVPDLPVDEAADCAAVCGRIGLAFVPIAAPSSSDSRLVRMVGMARGFLYVVSRPGVTGGGAGAAKELEPLVRRLRRLTDLPLCVGFGISTRQDVERMARLFDGVIVGSAFLRILLEDGGRPARALEFVRTLFGTEVRRNQGNQRRF